MRAAVYAGSFDPPTNGHVWMIEEGAKLFDRLVVGVGTNPIKRPSFTETERLSLLERLTRGLDNVSVESFPQQYLVDFAREHDASFLLRGVRNADDFRYEWSMHNVNRGLAPDILTVPLFPDRDLADVSSSFVKGMVGPHGWESVIGEYVPHAVLNAMLRKFDGFLQVFGHAWAGLGATGDFRPIYHSVKDMYGDASRRYHALPHLAFMFRELREVFSCLDDPWAVHAAAFFHDARYDLLVPDAENVEASARLAEESLLQGHAPPGKAALVADLVRATKHDGLPVGNDAAYLQDADLAILGAEASVYQAYERLIWEEYAPVIRNIGLAAFKEKRAEVLSGFLERADKVYHTMHAIEKYGGRVRENLEWSLARLSDEKA